MSASRHGLLLGLAALFTAQIVTGQAVHHAPQGLVTLADRLAWAEAQASTAGTIVWTIEGTGGDHWMHRNSRTLADLLGISEPADRLVAVVVRREGGEVSWIRTVSIDSHVETGRGPLLILGPADHETSFSLLARMDLPEDALKGRIHAAGRHTESSVALTHIQNALASRVTEHRKAGAYALGGHQGEAAIPRLTDIAGDDAEAEVSKAAAYAIGSMDSDAAVDALKRVLARSDRREVRKAAVYAIGNVGTPYAQQVLLEVIATEQ